MSLATAVVPGVVSASGAFDRFHIEPILGSACIKHNLIG